MKTQNAILDQSTTAAIEKSRGADPQRRTLSVQEAGRALGISRGTAYAQVKTGAIPTIKLGKRLLVPKAAFDKLLEGI